MPVPEKAKIQTREQVLRNKIPDDVLAKYLHDERIETAKRLEEFRREESRREESRREQSRREQSRRESSKNQEELMTASITLGIPINSSIREIKKAYHRLAMQTHPDKHPHDPNAKATFQKIGSAYQTLMQKKGGNKCRNRRTYHKPKKTQTHRHTTHHRKTHRVRV